MLYRAALIIGNRGSVLQATNPTSVDDPYSMLAYAFLVLALNISLFGCVLARLIAKLRKYSERDHLTGLLNRRASEARLAIERTRHERNGRAFSLILFDIDHFKAINDQHGHSSGDRALKHVAELLRTTLRQIDSVARVGGEEFLILLPETELREAGLIAERLRTLLAAQPLQLADKTIPVQASFGYVSSRAGSNEQLLTLVDKALYRAKACGRNCSCAADGNSSNI